MWCWCLSVTGTTGIDILIHSRKIGFEVSMAKSELSDCCKLMFGELLKVWRGFEFRKVEMDYIIIIFHYAYGARGYEAATNIQSWYATRTWSLIPSPKC
jgi:hypothetical protein